MKKKIFIFASCALLLGACGGNEKKGLDQDSARIAELTSEYNEATTFNDSLMLLMGDIYTGLDSINTQEGLLHNIGGDNVDRRAEIRRNLTTIKSRLAANRQLLDQLESKVKSSKDQNSVQLKTIERLKSYIATQDAKIAQLEQDLENAKGEIANLNTQVAQTQEQVRTETAAKEQAQQQAVAAEDVANTVYYALGTGKELKDNQITSKKFLGATKVLQGDFNHNYFTKADKRTLNTIRTNSKKAKILSNMPEGSYQIVENNDGLKVIQITNPAKFWSLTPYLVIKTD